MRICDTCGEEVNNISVVKRVIKRNGETIIIKDHMCAKCKMKEYSISNTKK